MKDKPTQVSNNNGNNNSNNNNDVSWNSNLANSI